MLALALALIALAISFAGCGDSPAVFDAAPVDAMADARPDAEPPGRDRLSDVGLYADIGNRTLADGVVEFRPTHVLWSDGAVKTRWIKLPPGGVIDTSDMDRWVFPVGTKFFKEFVRDGVVVETRMIEKLGTGSMDFWMGAFVWSLDESDAVFAPAGAMNANGTDHDVPDSETCWACHLGEPSRSLGFSAIQLSRDDSGVTLASLAADGLLSDPPPLGEDYPAPGTASEAAALGYLHANCGHCHNERGLSWPDTDMDLRLRVADRVPTDTAIYQSTVGVVLQKWMHPTISLRVNPGDPTTSALLVRMLMRGDRDAMPPLATELVDTDAAAVVEAWIAALPAPP